MRTLAKLAPAALVFALSAAAQAQTPADEHTARATRAYNLQDWPSALAEFKAAYAIDPKPELLWSIAQVQRLGGDCRSAILTYQAYIRGASASGANAAQTLVAKCQATLAEQKQAALAAEAPPPRVVVVRVPAPAAKPAKRPWYADPLGDVLGAVALGALATGAVFLTAGNVAMAAAPDVSSYRAYDRAVADARAQQEVGVGVAIGGAALVGLAIWRFVFLASHRAKKEATPSVGLAPLPGGAMGTWSVRFR